MFTADFTVFEGILRFVSLRYEETNGVRITLHTERPILENLRILSPEQGCITFVNNKSTFRLIWEQHQIRIMLDNDGIEIETRIPTTEEKLSSLHRCLAEWKRLAFPE
jgi:hypothetical protein